MAGYDRPLASAGALGTHRLTEALKHAFAMRMNLGDPETPGGIPGLAQALEDMLVAVDQLAERVESLESILDADHPDWRQNERSKTGKEQQS